MLLEYFTFFIFNAVYNTHCSIGYLGDPESICYGIPSPPTCLMALMPSLCHRALAMVGLMLIALGTGGIKPCVSAFGGDQFEDHQVRSLHPTVETFSHLCILTEMISSKKCLIYLFHSSLYSTDKAKEYFLFCFLPVHQCWKPSLHHCHPNSKR